MLQKILANKISVEEVLQRRGQRRATVEVQEDEQDEDDEDDEDDEVQVVHPRKRKERPARNNFLRSEPSPKRAKKKKKFSTKSVARRQRVEDKELARVLEKSKFDQ